MASLHNSAVSIGVLHRPSAGVHAPPLISVAPRRHLHSNTHLHLGLERNVRVVGKKRWNPVLASNAKGASDAKSVSDDDNSRPSLLSILAGMALFLFGGYAMLCLSAWLIFG